MSTVAQNHINIEAELQAAIGANTLHLHYQPKADLQSGQIVGMEALLRWQHPTHGLIPPTVFIPVAENSELIVRLGDWVIQQVCADIVNWLAVGLKPPSVAINISPVQLQDPGLTSRLSHMLQAQNLISDQISLEITENVLMYRSENIDKAFSDFKQKGYLLALDDFGTGYSALSYLKHFPFDYVKIDKSFIKEIPHNPDDVSITKAVIAMAHSLGIKVIAEGVETEAQCKFLSDNMCDQIQGHFFSRPINAEQMQALLKDRPVLDKHLLRMGKPDRTLLLVDDEPNILNALKRLLRKDDYRILIANSGQEGLEILERNQVDVIISDQRMPLMTGVEFLRNAKKSYPETVRIILSGYTELQYITDAINEGAIYKFLTKPWDDELIRANIREAFHYKEMEDENRRLTLQVQTTNQELISANKQLAEMLKQKQKQISRDELSLSIVREVLQYVPMPIIAVDDEDMVVFMNSSAEKVIPASRIELGCQIEHLIPEAGSGMREFSEGLWFPVEVYGQPFDAQWKNMGEQSKPSGKIVMLIDHRC
ncbi:EAL domain-containing protein [Undibacterium sp. TS12]|uniref:EAL domain-containing protein n=1 Tax=Undibacterium sp. TS12 TaxID=2908202 RepID=UPI001F4CF23D|nr:EAL domain-containing protein [Undibacterium sp. TS12]MCH8618680.1 EAL domain-containing protein [Undibacterium sp. TS12]